ncbi:F-box/kelch-repeat protein At1g57790 [Citrus clementina]|uniref:F-box/kelch-repeat protein At1g57790 n=1 Tax=Citrus clementina TaxID=85681 RepID=UPI0007638C18|nr:F-box/kelch-repeat protein At1g57790 [Citrus x clementina]
MAGGIKEKQKLERRSWSDLPLVIIHLIVSRLYVVYQIRFGAVCKRWRSVDIQYRDKFTWLMGYNSHSCYLYNPCHKQRFTVFNSDKNRTTLLGARPLDSKHGWIINLPVWREFSIAKATFSETPVSPDCVVFVTWVGIMEISCISICRPGDTTWIELRFRDNYRYVKNMVCADGFLYCSFFSLEAIVAYNVASQNWEILPYPPSILFMYKYLTEYDGSLLIFGKVVNSSGYRVFTLNRSQMDWFEIECLDDRALFMGASCLWWVPAEKGCAFANTMHWFGPYSYIRDQWSEFIRKPVESDSSKVAPRTRGYEYWKEEDTTQIWIQPCEKINKFGYL